MSRHRPAEFAEIKTDGSALCHLCPHYCRLQIGQTGICRVRHNDAGQLQTSGYGYPVILAVEPIEKKYLFHVLPGCQTLSLATPGCNLRCKYCINWRISQQGVAAGEVWVEPAAVVDRALEAGVSAIAFTYTEPAIYFEYARDIAQLAGKVGLKVVAKSNGFISPQVVKAMASWLTAINIDLKGWHSAAYQKVIGGNLAPVLESLRLFKELGVWVEVSTLLVPGFNTNSVALQQMSGFIANTLGAETPWHILRFFPNYQMLNVPVTSQSQLQQAVEIGEAAGLKYIYCKDITHGDQFETYCPHCRLRLISRTGYRVSNINLNDAYCPNCGYQVSGVNLDAAKQVVEANNV
ncbi:MAG: AmmeMemoRadiSam system radical SAM enzyme [Chloroflexi bacterium]|nr:AmmeMemoRadiSam system radical SAM enzyme [Chloroflexota bacterium]